MRQSISPTTDPPRSEARPGPGDREVSFSVNDLSCHRCARRAAEVLRRLEGVHRASVGLLREKICVRFDPRRTSAREIAAFMARAGYRLQLPPRLAAERPPWTSPGFSISLVGFANLLALTLVTASEPPTRALGVAKLMLTTVVLAASTSTLARHAWIALRRGRSAHEALTLAMAILSFAIGMLELAFASQESRVLPSWLAALGFRTASWQTFPPWGLLSAAIIIVAWLITTSVAVALEERTLADVRARVHARASSARRLEHDGTALMIPEAELAPGDRLHLLEGERSPCDLYLEEATRALVQDPGAGLVAREFRKGSVLGAGAILLSAEAEGRVLSMPCDLGSAMDAEIIRALGHATRGAESASSWEEIAHRTLAAAMLGFSVFAWVTHAFFGGGLLSPMAPFAAIAILVGVSPAALSLAAPVARTIALSEARAMGVVIKDPRALEKLALIDVACLDKAGTVTSHDKSTDAPVRKGAASALRSLWNRRIGSRLLASDPPKVLARLAHELAVPSTGGLSAQGMALVVRDLQLGGARVLFVTGGVGDAAHLVQADVTMAITEDTLPGSIAAPIVVTNGQLSRLPWLVDLGRALRRRILEGVAVCALYNAAILPAAVLGLLAPHEAAGLAALEALLLLANAARLLRAARPAASAAIDAAPTHRKDHAHRHHARA